MSMETIYANLCFALNRVAYVGKWRGGIPAPSQPLPEWSREKEKWRKRSGKCKKKEEMRKK